MANKGKTIPLHRLKEMTDKDYVIERVEVEVSSKWGKSTAVMETHRDDHYIFLLQLKGRSSVMVDFANHTVKGKALTVILPGQVHQYLHSDEDAAGWFVAMDIGMIPDQFKRVLHDPILSEGVIKPTEKQLETLLQCLEMVHGIIARKPAIAYDRQIIYGSLQLFVALVASVMAERSPDDKENVSRPKEITQNFRQLLSDHYKELKSPAGYAAKLNISLSYLNEVVKATTGFAVSHWIHHEIVQEAKRLLYHSTANVKEIAYQLGYEDHAYFSRLFSKMTGRTPGDFRRYYRE